MIKDIGKYYKLITLAILLAITTIVVSLYIGIERNARLEVVFFDIGQGDSQLIKTPAGQNILIDTGPNYISTQKVENNLSKIYGKLDAVLLTHPDLDHVGGTKELIDNMKIDNLIISKENVYDNYKLKDGTKVLSVHKGHDVLLDYNLMLETLSPESGSIGDSNQNSIVNRLKYGNYEFIFMGDADAEVERELVAKGYFDSERYTILKVGHHGSNTSSSEIFLKKIKPEYCIISVGKDNSYNHPSVDVMLKLEKYCKNIYRTDNDGDIRFITDGYNLSIEKTK